MSLLLASIALGAVAAGWVITPILRRRLAVLADAVPGGVVDAQARKRVALASLREIEYDRIGGKLDDEDYHRLRRQLEREALLAIDAVDLATGPRTGTDDAPVSVTHACGFVNPLGSRFCAGCGTPL